MENYQVADFEDEENSEEEKTYSETSSSYHLTTSNATYYNIDSSAYQTVVQGITNLTTKSQQSLSYTTSITNFQHLESDTNSYNNNTITNSTYTTTINPITKSSSDQPLSNHLNILNALEYDTEDYNASLEDVSISNSSDVLLTILDFPESREYDPGIEITVQFSWQKPRTHLYLAEILYVVSSSIDDSSIQYLQSSTFYNDTYSPGKKYITVYSERKIKREDCHAITVIQLPTIKGNYKIVYYVEEKEDGKILGKSLNFKVRQNLEMKIKTSRSDFKRIYQNKERDEWEYKVRLIYNNNIKMNTSDLFCLVEKEWWEDNKNKENSNEFLKDIYLRSQAQDGVLFIENGTFDKSYHKLKFDTSNYEHWLRDLNVKDYYMDKKMKKKDDNEEKKEWKFLYVILTRGFAEGKDVVILAESDVIVIS